MLGSFGDSEALSKLKQNLYQGILDPQALCCCFPKFQSIRLTESYLLQSLLHSKNAQRSPETYVRFTYTKRLTQLARLLFLELCSYTMLKQRIFQHSLTCVLIVSCVGITLPSEWGLSDGRLDFITLCWFFPFSSFPTPPRALAYIGFELIAQKLFYEVELSSFVDKNALRQTGSLTNFISLYSNFLGKLKRKGITITNISLKEQFKNKSVWMLLFLTGSRRRHRDASDKALLRIAVTHSPRHVTQHSDPSCRKLHFKVKSNKSL